MAKNTYGKSSTYGQKRFPIGIALGLFVAYVAFGDSVLPGQAGIYSLRLRSTLNNMLITAFPTFQTKNPNQRTEDALKREGVN
jgi:hypothetical protein